MSPRREQFLPYALPLIEDDDIEAVVDSLKSNWISKGPKTGKFEKRFAEYIGVKHAIALNSCTAGLHIALLAAGVGAGDEVITTAMTFAASSNVIIHCGATPVLVDIDPQTMNIDPAKIEEKITSKTKAIIPVHLAGLPCEMDKIMQIAKEYNLFVLEDAAHGTYTKYKDRMVGTIGDAAAFSFYATKNLATGEGGMVTTNDDELANKMRVLSLHGMSRNAWNRFSEKGSWYYEIEYPGYKYNMTDIQAAMGMTQLAKLESMQARREVIWQRYNEAFSKLPELEVPADFDYARHARHLYMIRLNLAKLTVNRAEVIELLKEENIGTSVHYIPLPYHPYYRDTYGYKPGDFPKTEALYERIISLPLYPRMSDADVQDVIEAVQRVIEKIRL
ncbi:MULTISPECIES: DegT/DnrJ/EryC1/StrS family aminotransferase [unclassified Dehalobacter]|jgi:Predicted pyridoxal phosphate-dependent enzyme apparently involved in regulation of cell wall biogenesis|uniref:DegT/DnrJ/EryC1/StrS family aminotransferase n=1 Tax=unclassified Dehalobacter TaxID=2635733 RepID=UPI00028ADA6C|nr:MULTISPECIES: DegT/DnrJ/EryC1/StrS family aminotransferase [unclassified Dehalobacter]AFV03702.1 Bacillosamine/Legionaminic acid biosynthesis aminotransferase PglE; 4-keto-6-deoxy-N-Acetyl-D-hexosaminyl-(Lipid carrier) aminotransferase [Dehalobacter sp. DCA]AFV06689.1 Bacillosamine/Legionaminic acid biosynthesis aminotransferase PglE; 4-keto-6-deoxy-N-Acetyl-D-hexosaminyl-(Lipid carrier) aminotransferase [Dehalobacter sp. CF]